MMNEEFLKKLQALVQETLTSNQSMTDTKSEIRSEDNRDDSVGRSEEGDRSVETKSSEQSSNSTTEPKQENKEIINKQEDEVQAKLSALETSIKDKDTTIASLQETIAELKKGLSSGNKETLKKEKPSIYKSVFGKH